MLTRDENERLTRIGPGTPAGELIRRYWQALCPAAELTKDKPIKPLRLLGEDLLVFRDGQGRFALVEGRCRHRRVSLARGFVEDDGIRCAYHGWKYATDGRCIEQPFEPADSRLKDDVRLRAYPVQALGGLLFGYLGPAPAPLLPRWDVLVREDGRRFIQILPLHHCNWLQCEENTADTVHTYYLHGHMARAQGLDIPGADYYERPIARYEWSVCEWGLEKVLEYGGEHPEVEIRPPLIFPNILRVPQGPVEAIHFRVPIDDTQTRILWVGFMPDPEARTPEGAALPFEYLEAGRNADGEHDLRSFYSQDQWAWESQGEIYNRSEETLGATDRGVVLFRKMLAEQIDRVAQGLAPSVGVVTDPSQNRCIDFPSATRPAGGSEAMSFVNAAAPA
jgi:5,5'-dehydrodivanillate O-demethylase oxygenase subunit